MNGAQEAILASLADHLDEQGSWSGETHIQKASFILRDLFDVPFDFDFILYKHGPFSFGLRDALSMMRTEGLVERQPQPSGYGPRILASEAGLGLRDRYPRTMNRWDTAIDWVAHQIGDLGVIELERVATALWVTRRDPEASVSNRADALTGIKPHISRDAAVRAVEKVDQLIQESESVPVG